jgi:hypothetical protein
MKPSGSAKGLIFLEKLGGYKLCSIRYSGYVLVTKLNEAIQFGIKRTSIGYYLKSRASNAIFRSPDQLKTVTLMKKVYIYMILS